MLTKPLKILIVEDDPASRKLLRGCILKSSIEITAVEAAESIDETLQVLNTEQFDVILLDLNLPGSYGNQTISTVTAAQSSAAIIVVSGLDSEDMDFQGAEDDIQGYLTKGEYDISILENTITEALERKQNQ